jgi:hypothetical protein
MCFEQFKNKPSSDWRLAPLGHVYDVNIWLYQIQKKGNSEINSLKMDESSVKVVNGQVTKI